MFSFLTSTFGSTLFSFAFYLGCFIFSRTLCKMSLISGSANEASSACTSSCPSWRRRRIFLTLWLSCYLSFLAVCCCRAFNPPTKVEVASWTAEWIASDIYLRVYYILTIIIIIGWIVKANWSHHPGPHIRGYQSLIVFLFYFRVGISSFKAKNRESIFHTLVPLTLPSVHKEFGGEGKEIIFKANFLLYLFIFQSSTENFQFSFLHLTLLYLFQCL